jgi:hypothetical protein
LEPFTTVSFWATKIIARKEPFVVDFNVLMPVSGDQDDRSLADARGNSKADLLVAICYFLYETSPLERSQCGHPLVEVP